MGKKILISLDDTKKVTKLKEKREAVSILGEKIQTRRFEEKFWKLSFMDCLKKTFFKKIMIFNADFSIFVIFRIF